MNLNYPSVKNTLIQVWLSPENTVNLHPMRGKAHMVWKKITIGMLIMIMGSLLLNQALYTHTHVMPDGSIVSHAHPFNKSQESEQGGSHQHSSLEYFLLQNLLLLFSAAIGSLVLNCAAPGTRFREAIPDHALPMLVPFSPNRAPPVCM